MERIIIVVATMVLAYGFWIGFTESVEQGAVYAVPASLVLLAAVWRRGVFELPWFP